MGQQFIRSKYTTTDVETALKTKLLSYYGYNGMYFQDTIYPQDIEYVIQQAPGIKTVKVTALHELLGSGLNTLSGGAGEIFRFQESNIGISEM